MLNVAYDAFMLNVFMLSAVAPFIRSYDKNFFWQLLSFCSVKLDRLDLKTISTYASKAPNKYLTLLCPRFSHKREIMVKHSSL